MESPEPIIQETVGREQSSDAVQLSEPGLAEHKLRIQQVLEEVSWRKSMHHGGLQENFMGAICPASLHTCHPDMIRTWQILRESWISLLNEATESRPTKQLRQVTFDSLRVARSQTGHTPPVQGCGKAASIILEDTNPIWFLHDFDRPPVHPGTKQATTCTLFTSCRPCKDDRGWRYLIKYGHEYKHRGKKNPYLSSSGNKSRYV